MSKYGWISFLEDLPKILPRYGDLKGSREKVKCICFRWPQDDHDIAVDSTSSLFDNYSSDQMARVAVEHLMRIHAETAGDDDVRKSNHNVLVYAYMMKVPFSDKQIAGRLNFTYGAARQKRLKTLNNITILIAGIQDLPEVQDYAKGIKRILGRYQLLAASLKVDPDQLTGKLQSCCQEGQEITRKALEGFRLLVDLYVEYATNENYCYEEDELRLTVLNGLLENKTVKQISKEMRRSKESIYIDIRDITRKMSDLANIIVHDEGLELVG